MTVPAERLLRDLASLMLVEHQIDDGDPAQLRARLAPLVDADQSLARAGAGGGGAA